MEYDDTNYEPQIPKHISRICVASAHLYLVPGIIFLFCNKLKLKLLGINIFFLYLSSILHWYEPKFDSVIHYVDLFMVVESTTFCTYVMYTTNNLVFAIWMVNITTAFAVFLYNEFMYYHQVLIPKKILRENPNMIISIKDDSRSIMTLLTCIDPTYPNSVARTNAYYRSVIIHALFIHGLSAGTAGITNSILCLLYFS